MNRLTIGCDPELAICDSTVKLKHASIFFRDVDNNIFTKFGLDGASSTAELRTEPSTHPENQVNQIADTLEAYKPIIKFAYINEFYGSNTEIPLGGHIHLGNEKLVPGENIKHQVIKNLDLTLSILTTLSSNPLNTQKRLRCGYGKLSDHRMKEWGIEYRTPPSFLASRQLASSVLFLAYAVAHDTIENNFKSSLYSEHSFVNTIYSQINIPAIYKLLPKVIADIKTLELYNEPDYKKNINWLVNKAKYRQDVFSGEIKNGWGIKFDKNKHIKLSSLSDILDNSIDNLSLENQGNNYLDKFIKINEKHHRTVKIKSIITEAIKKSINHDTRTASEFYDISSLYIYGLKQNRGNIIKIHIHPRHRADIELSIKKIKSILAKTTKNKYKIAIYNNSSANKIGLGYNLRKDNLQISSQIVAILFFYLNDELISNKRINTSKLSKKIISKKIKLPRPLYKTKKIPGIKIPFDLNCNYFEAKAELKRISPIEKQDFILKMNNRIDNNPYLKNKIKSHKYFDNYIHIIPDKPLKTMSKIDLYATLALMLKTHGCLNFL